MKTSSSRKASIVLVALFLVTTAVSAESRPGARAHSARIAGLSSVESFSGFWSVLVGLWTKNGCQVDPDGRCLPTKNGCSVDPSGRCLPPATTTITLDNGCQVDPNGSCAK
jgi:hypothetical protein